MYSHNRSTAFPFTDFHENRIFLKATRADLHRISFTNRLPDVYSADKKFSYEAKYCRAFSAPIFMKKYIYINIYILQIVKSCLDFLPNTLKIEENTEKFQLVRSVKLLHHSVGSPKTDFCSKIFSKQRHIEFHEKHKKRRSLQHRWQKDRQSNGRKNGWTDSWMEESCLQILMLAVLRKDRMTSLRFCSTIIHGEHYVLQYNYAWWALRSAVQLCMMSLTFCSTIMHDEP